METTAFWQLLKKGRELSVVDLAGMIFNECSMEDYEVWLVSLWMIWHFVCQAYHGQQQVSDLDLGERSKVMWLAYQEEKPTVNLMLGVPLGCKLWRRPRKGQWRVDVDAVFDPGWGYFGVGVVVRDSLGKVKLAMVRKINPYSSCVMAELIVVIYIWDYGVY